MNLSLKSQMIKQNNLYLKYFVSGSNLSGRAQTPQLTLCFLFCSIVQKHQELCDVIKGTDAASRLATTPSARSLFQPV